MTTSEETLFIAKITSMEEKGSCYEDDLYPNPDANPDRTEIEFESLCCSKAAFIEALYTTKEGINFVHTPDSMLIDIGGSRLDLEVGKQIVIHSDFTVTN